MAKIFVLDTNIILHDHNAIRQFRDNDIVIPVAVIEELDKFKKGNDNLSFHARAFMREISTIMDGKKMPKEGFSLGKKMGHIKIEPNHPFEPEMQNFFKDDIPDHRILATAMWVRDHHPKRFTALVTKDINLRLKAKAVGMEAQDYLTDRLDDDVMDSMEALSRASHTARREACTGRMSLTRTPAPTSCSSSRSETHRYVPDMMSGAVKSFL